MLQGFIDDSGSSPNDPVYVLGGFISTIPRWLAFSDEWQAILDCEPKLGYFKASEARARDGEFRNGWNPGLIAQRVLELTEAACRHAQFRVHCFLRRSDFDRLIMPVANRLPDIFSHNFKNPYFLCLQGIVMTAQLNKQAARITDPIEYVLDEHGVLGDLAVHSWRLAREAIGNDVPDYFMSPPTFKNDKAVLPLQAADLYAWNIHESLASGKIDIEQIDHIKKAMAHVPCIECFWSPEMLLGIARDLVQTWAEVRKQLKELG
jgi:hypothetical protein